MESHVSLRNQLHLLSHKDSSVATIIELIVFGSLPIAPTGKVIITRESHVGILTIEGIVKDISEPFYQDGKDARKITIEAYLPIAL